MTAKFYVSKNQNRLVFKSKNYTFQPFEISNRSAHRFGVRPEGWTSYCSGCPLAHVFCDPRAPIGTPGMPPCRARRRRDSRTGYWKEVTE